MKLPIAICLLIVAGLLPVGAGEFKVSDLTFTAPEGWKSEEPSSKMRKAQLAVGEGEAKGEVTFFHFGPRDGGGLEANIKRWFGQFKEGKDAINAKTEKAKAGDLPVTYVSAEGTFLSGPPFGKKVEKPGYALLGAIIEAKGGAIFVKFTAPATTVKKHAEAFKTMVAGAK